MPCPLLLQKYCQQNAKGQPGIANKIKNTRENYLDKHANYLKMVDEKLTVNTLVTLFMHKRGTLGPEQHDARPDFAAMVRGFEAAGEMRRVDDAG